MATNIESLPSSFYLHVKSCKIKCILPKKWKEQEKENSFPSIVTPHAFQSTSGRTAFQSIQTTSEGGCSISCMVSPCQFTVGHFKPPRLNVQPKTPATSPCMLVSPLANLHLEINQHLLNVQPKTPATSPCLLVSTLANSHMALADDPHHPRPLSLHI